MNSSRIRVHQSRQGIDIGSLEFGNLAMLDQELRQLVAVPRKPFQCFLIRACFPRDGRLAFARQFQVIEQDLAKLLERGDVEFTTGLLVDFSFKPGQLPAHVFPKPIEEWNVKADAVELKFGEDLD